jgi:hypothetical protein
VDKLVKELESLPKSDDGAPASAADLVSVMMKIGRRHVYDGQYSQARVVLLDAYSLVKGKPEVYNDMKNDDYARLLEWTGMVKHWTYELDSAANCYEEMCSSGTNQCKYDLHYIMYIVYQKGHFHFYNVIPVFVYRLGLHSLILFVPFILLILFL